MASSPFRLISGKYNASSSHFFGSDRLVLRNSTLVRIWGNCWRDQTMYRKNLISSCCLFYGQEQPASRLAPVAPPMPAVADGLWPDYNDGTWPACCPGKRFDMKEISTLLSIMKKYWPSFSCESASNCHGGTGLFWEHEWEKHGPCSAPVVRDEYDYFVTALNLYFKHNVTEVLREAGYVASNSEKYPLRGIVSAIENAFHATPQLVCSGSIRISRFGIVLLDPTLQKDHVPDMLAYQNPSRRWMLKTKKLELQSLPL